MDSQSPDAPRVSPVDLELRQVFKNFGSLEVIRNLSLTVSKGELCCLLGPSGCGKTTVLNIINGLLEPDSGEVLMAGQDITRMPPQRRNLGMVFQNYALFPHMNVYDNVAYGLHRRKVPGDKVRPKVTEALELVRLPDYEGRRTHELSGGEQQRISLARALVIEPSLLLLDEPLSNLDARLRADMRDEIRRIQRKLNVTTIYVTHDQEEAMSIADRIFVMNRGVIEQIGTPREIYEQPATLFVADFIGRVNFLQGRIVNNRLLLAGKEFTPPPGEWVDGAKVICAIRPEGFQIRGAGLGLFNATVKDASYLGSVVRYRLSFKNDEGTETELTVEVAGPLATYQPGDDASLDLQSENLRLFPDRALPDTSIA